MLDWEELQVFKMYFLLLLGRYPTIIHLKGLTVTGILPMFYENFVKTMIKCRNAHTQNAPGAPRRLTFARSASHNKLFNLQAQNDLRLPNVFRLYIVAIHGQILPN